MIVVFGSINLDLVARVQRLPRPGETLSGSAFATSPGGKGANQALAARRAGSSSVAMFGAVGRDAFASPALALLREAGVDLGGVAEVDAATGVALIHVEDSGENAITVIAGANARALAAQVPDAALGASTTLVMQLETPVAQCLALAQRARARGARVVLNAAPAMELHPDWRHALDWLFVNEHEARVLAGAFGFPDDAIRFADGLWQRHRVATVITLGARGAIGVAEGKRYSVPALPVHAIDTVGAGDAFVGAFAAALDAGAALPAAFARGAAGGGLACTRAGAQVSLAQAADIAAAAATLESRIQCETVAD